MNVSSTISGSLKCSRTRARHSSVTSRSSRVVRSQNSSAACSRSLKCGLLPVAEEIGQLLGGDTSLHADGVADVHSVRHAVERGHLQVEQRA